MSLANLLSVEQIIPEMKATERWAAIAPICGGGNPMTAAKFKDLPCWCFHGDADPTVPYQQATRLNAALQQAGATSELVTIPGGKHGGFPPAQQLRAMDAVRAFLTRNGLMPKPAAGTGN